MDEDRALHALQKKSEPALAWFIRRYGSYVNTVIYYVLGGQPSGQDIEEVSSDVFLVLWRNAEKIRPGKVKAYLSSTARNLAKEKRRALGRELPLEDDVLTGSDTSMEHFLEVREQAGIIKQAMLTMAAPDREIFLRHYYYYQPLSQIAEEMGMNLSTVKTRLRRGRSKLQDALRKGGFCDEDI